MVEVLEAKIAAGFSTASAFSVADLLDLAILEHRLDDEVGSRRASA